MIYLAAPYNHKDADIVELRVRAINQAHAKLMQQGSIVYSPILVGHNCKQEDVGLQAWSHKDWLSYDINILRSPDISSVQILTLPGWGKSKGIRQEIEVASKVNLPVIFIDPEVCCEPKILATLRTHS